MTNVIQPAEANRLNSSILGGSQAEPSNASNIMWKNIASSSGSASVEGQRMSSNVLCLAA